MRAAGSRELACCTRRSMGVRSRLVLFRFSLSHGYHRSLARRPRPSVRGCCKELERDWALDGMSWLQSSCLSLPLKFEERLAPWQICVPTPHSLISAISVGLALVFLGLFLFLDELALFLGLFQLLVELTLLSRLGICPDTRELPSVSWQLQAQMSHLTTAAVFRVPVHRWRWALTVLPNKYSYVQIHVSTQTNMWIYRSLTSSTSMYAEWLRGHRSSLHQGLPHLRWSLQSNHFLFKQLEAAGRGRGCARRRPFSAMDAYNRIRKIGKGAMGCASLVERKKDRHLVVVKEINVKGLSERDRQEAMKEVEVLKQLQHPHIVCMYEAFLQGGNLNIVMEYADAGDLAQLLRNANGRRFKETKILDLFGQIAQGMYHVHSLNILHRDLKTANILLTREGVIKLADFGIARVMSSDTDMAETRIGTPYYLSPEICEDKPYNKSSDVWSLGCVLYELTTLQHAFEGKNLPALVLKIIRGKYPAVPTSYSLDLRGLISSMLQVGHVCSWLVCPGR